MKSVNLSTMWKDSSLWMPMMAVIFFFLASFFRSEDKTNLLQCEVLPVHDNQPFVSLSGCDVKDFLAAGALGEAKLRELMLKHGLLVFRDQHLMPAQEVALNKVFGWHLEGALIQSGFTPNASEDFKKKHDQMPVLPDEPEVLCQGNAELHDHFGLTRQLQMTLTYSNCGWHSDGMHAQQTDLPVLTSMYCLQAPVSGGETFFADGRHAFASATPEVQKKARRLLTHHIFDFPAHGSAIMQNGIRRLAFERQNGTGSVTGHKGGVHSVHPLVRKHPDTGVESLYVSAATIDYMEANATETEPAIYLDTAASFDFVETLIGAVTSSPLVYAHKWREGDFVIWDNRVTMHSPGEPTEMDGKRLHHRIRLAGNAVANQDLAFWKDYDPYLT